MTRKRYKRNRQSAWRGKFGMPVRAARILARQAGKCLRCLKNKASIGTRCYKCRERREEDNKRRKR